ncbi:hypothetical protein D9757_010208 [Collybiopsis confluens]|uniref:Uncharacterized protein n=1 Tax=Collybiopsis confluens TaxID=2823264 RepID=A0A8H5GQ25_9AGAR|nr:hypothetical protein D9757_010208 [Collybiopsis confluens]
MADKSPKIEINFMFANIKKHVLVSDPREPVLCFGKGPLWTKFNQSVREQSKSSQKYRFLIPPAPIIYGPSTHLWERVANLLPPQYFSGEWEVWETGAYPRELTEAGPFVDVFVVPISQYETLSEEEDKLTELRVSNISKRDAETPSIGARPSIFADRQKRNPIAMGRPKTAHHYGIPIPLLHPAFAKFKEDIVSGPIDTQLSTLAFRWTRELSEFFGGEPEREAKFHQLLSELLDGFRISKKRFSGYTTDGGIDPKESMQNFIDLYVKPLLVEVKVETTCGGVDAILECVLYDLEAMRLSLTNDKFGGSWRKTRLPSMIVIHNGPNIQVLGAVWLADQYVEVLSPSLPLYFNEFDTEAFERLLRFMTSLRTLFRSLLEIYQDPEQHAVQHDQVTFPYPSSYDIFDGSVESSTEVGTPSAAEDIIGSSSAEVSSTEAITASSTKADVGTSPEDEPVTESSPQSRLKVQFCYTERVDPIRLVFKACTTDGENIIIKFGYGRYGLEAHRAAGEAGLAPALLGYSKLTGGWWMAAMELLHEGFQSCAKIGVNRSCKSVIGSSIRAFHSMGFVHGDLRASNILVRRYDDQWECRLIDFDWAGYNGQVKYPYGVYRTSSMFRPMANMDQLPITVEHDEATLANMLTECRK